MKREEPHCKAVRLFPLVEHRGFVWLTCGGGDVTLCELFGQFASRRLRVHYEVEVGLGIRTPRIIESNPQVII